MDVPTRRRLARTPAGQLALLELRTAVLETGFALAQARVGSTDARGLVDARREHVSAMTAYETALESMHFPVPRQLRDALRLQSRVAAMSEPVPILYAPRTAR
jgi:hypothetical protein